MSKKHTMRAQAGQTVCDIRRALASLGVVARPAENLGDDVVESTQIVEELKPMVRTILDALAAIERVTDCDPKPFSAAYDVYIEELHNVWGAA